MLFWVLGVEGEEGERGNYAGQTAAASEWELFLSFTTITSNILLLHFPFDGPGHYHLTLWLLVSLIGRRREEVLLLLGPPNEIHCFIIINM